MGNKKLALILTIPFILGSFLSGQSLAELSKKEKERRESLKDKKAAVITNADLARAKRKAALETPPPSPFITESGTPAEASPAEDQTSIESQFAESDLGVQPLEPGREEPAGESSADGYRTSLENRYAKAKEYADLLELKMAALWQEFYNLGDMTSRDAIEQEIALTFDKLEKAREDENAAKKKLDDYLERIRRETGSRT